MNLEFRRRIKNMEYRLNFYFLHSIFLFQISRHSGIPPSGDKIPNSKFYKFFMSKAKINEELCIGCGTCESLCPNVFKIENGKAKVIAEDCDGCDCKEISESCPVSAIGVED